MDISAHTTWIARFELSSSPTTANDIFIARQKGKAPTMTDVELEAYLRDNGYPEHICQAGS
ncbi:MAG: hypothetical protein ABIZ80_17625, partial [Bryobacteraceae bacterium]